MVKFSALGLFGLKLFHVGVLDLGKSESEAPGRRLNYDPNILFFLPPSPIRGHCSLSSPSNQLCKSLFIRDKQNENMVAISDTSSVKVYTVNGATAGSSASLPDWLMRKRATAKGKGKRATRERIEGTIELIQGFEFPEASNRIKTTPDGQHAIATGTYKPQMKVWDLGQLSQKFERHSDAENVDFIVRESFLVSGTDGV